LTPPERILQEVQKSKGEKRVGAKADLGALGPEPLPPDSPDRTVSEPTYEGPVRKFDEGHPSLGIFSDEGGQFLGGLAMGRDNRTKTLAALNDLWQDNPIRRTRSGDGSLTLYGRRLSVHLIVQPGVARAFMADPQTSDTGFASKAAEQAARLAGVLTLWADLDAPQVEMATMAQAIDLAAYYLTEAARLAHEATISIETEQAERLRVWLLEAWPHPEIVPSEVVQNAPIRGLRVMKAARRAIKLLVEHGWLVPLERGVVVRGKARKEAYRIMGPD
jgi:hypothetical protein